MFLSKNREREMSHFFIGLLRQEADRCAASYCPGASGLARSVANDNADIQRLTWDQEEMCRTLPKCLMTRIIGERHFTSRVPRRTLFLILTTPF